MTNQNKKITFSFMNEVCIIYSISDHREYLWWSEEDLYSFKISAMIELRALANRHQNMNLRQAQKLLYQPGNMNIIYDENNFF